MRLRREFNALLEAEKVNITQMKGEEDMNTVYREHQLLYLLKIYYSKCNSLN